MARHPLMRLAELCPAVMVLAVLAGRAGAQIAVGPTVPVSTALPAVPHDEVSLGVDPANPNRLVACSMYEVSHWFGQHQGGAVVYGSVDGGRTWTLGTRTQYIAGDPSCAFGPDGSAYFVTVADDDRMAAGTPKLELHRSRDGGRTWGPPLFSPGGDRPWLVIDRVHGGSAGALYVVDQQQYKSLQPDSLHGLIGLTLRRSTDGGTSWYTPAIRLEMGGAVKPGSAATPARAVVLSDGTVVILYLAFERFPGTMPVRTGTIESRGLAYYVTTSADSGRTLTEGVKLTHYVQFYGLNGTPSTIAALAADVGGRSPFTDRLYAAWGDVRSGRTEIYLSYSADKGRTWSQPTIVSDDSAWTAPKAGPDNEMPTLAVSADGVVGLMWYDRRENADNVGFYPRFRASLDGGETWLPSVRLTDQPNRFVQPDGTQLATEVRHPTDASELSGAGPDADRRTATTGPLTVNVMNNNWLTNGHTAGLATDARGVFHALWVDNRTGVKQVYTAPVTVQGGVVRNGDPALTARTDLTPAVMLDLAPAAYDSVTHVVTVRAHLRNTSRDTLRGPFVLRAVRMTSELGRPRVLNADNNQAIEGATWQFGLSAGSMLPPGASTTERELKFQVTPQRGDGPAALKWGLVTIDARVLGGPASGRAP